MAAQTGGSVSRPGLCVTLKRLGWRASRRAPMSPPPFDPLRSAAFAERVKGIASEDLVFVGETGVSTKL